MSTATEPFQGFLQKIDLFISKSRNHLVKASQIEVGQFCLSTVRFHFHVASACQNQKETSVAKITASVVNFLFSILVL